MLAAANRETVGRSGYQFLCPCSFARNIPRKTVPKREEAGKGNRSEERDDPGDQDDPEPGRNHNQK